MTNSVYFFAVVKSVASWWVEFYILNVLIMVLFTLASIWNILEMLPGLELANCWSRVFRMQDLARIHTWPENGEFLEHSELGCLYEYSYKYTTLQGMKMLPCIGWCWMRSWGGQVLLFAAVPSSGWENNFTEKKRSGAEARRYYHHKACLRPF